MAKPYEYDRCQCGNRKLKISDRCRQCHHRRLKIAAQAHKLVLAVTQGESVIVIAEKRDDLVRLGRAVLSLRATFAAGRVNNSEQLQINS